MKTILLVVSFIFIALFAIPQNVEKSFTGVNTLLIGDGISQELKIYPNPCGVDKVNIEFGMEEIKEVRISNIAGKEVLLKEFPFPENKKQVEVSGLPSGIYILKIKTVNQKQVSKKLMISKN